MSDRRWRGPSQGGECSQSSPKGESATEQTAELVIRLNERTLIARMTAEDEQRLREFIAGGQTDLRIEPSSLDTQGHMASNEVAVDVEGHALTLRLPSAADAAALRRALAVGTLTAAVAIGGIAAANMAPPAAAPAAPDAVQAPQAAPAADLANFREQRLQSIENSPYTSAASSSSETEQAPEQGGTGSGPLEFNP
jgi:hypothetical protein